ncbi:MAG: hypothetical protein H6694_00305 [Candidatus Latescibacteria bacterium]|nr:hypothetical protein [Candidatus Latescibacterota bacterium]
MITPRRFAAPSRRRIPASLLALLGALLLPTGAFALDHSGAINSPETWHAADNPHVVVSNVSLATGVVLTLEDGVEVRFNGNTRIDAFGSSRRSARRARASPSTATPAPTGTDCASTPTAAATSPTAA